MPSPESSRPASRSESSEPEPTEARPAWDIEATTEVLRADATLQQHPVLGSGIRLTLREASGPIAPRLDLYPAHQVVRYRDHQTRLELVSIGFVGPEDDHARLVAGDDDTSTIALLYPDGSLTLATLPTPTETTQDPRSTPAPALATSERPTNGNLSTTGEVGDELPSAMESSPVTPDAASEREPRLTLRGRLGAAPHFRTSPNGTRIAELILAVHHGDDLTTWHPIVVFGARAQKLEGSLTKGDEVEIIGYVHPREKRGRDGTTRMIEEIYATVIRPPKAPGHTQKGGDAIV